MLAESRPQILPPSRKLLPGTLLADPAVVADLYAQFAELGPYQAHMLESAGLDRDATLSAVVAAVLSDRFRLGAA